MKSESILKNYFAAALLAVIFALTSLAQSANESRKTNLPGRCTFNVLTQEALVNYLSCNRTDVALASFSVLPDGSLNHHDPVLLHNVYKPMPLASTIKIVHLIAYAREVAEGRLNPQELISVADWERYFLPGVDGEAHKLALESFGIATSEYGFALDQDKQIPVEKLVEAMIEFSDNAAPDWLLERIGENRFREAIAAAGMWQQEMPVYFSGFNLTFNNHEDGPLTEQRIARLSGLSSEEYAMEARRLSALFLDNDWKQSEFQWRLQGNDSKDRILSGRAFDRLFPKGSAADYALLMSKVITGTFLSPEISKTMRRFLSWPLKYEFVAQSFSEAGNKGGSWDGGVLTDVFFFRPSSGGFAGKPRINVVFIRRMPLSAFDQISQGSLFYNFVSRLSSDGNFVRQTALRLRFRTLAPRENQP